MKPTDNLLTVLGSSARMFAYVLLALLFVGVLEKYSGLAAHDGVSRLIDLVATVIVLMDLNRRFPRKP